MHLFSYLGNGWADCAEILHVVRDPLARRFTKVDGELCTYTCTCARAHLLSVTREWLDYYAKIRCAFRGPLAIRFTQDGDICSSAHVTVH